MFLLFVIPSMVNYPLVILSCYRLTILFVIIAFFIVVVVIVIIIVFGF